MKVILILSSLLCMTASLHAAFELPAYLPPAPDETKAVNNYTVADVFGVVFTNPKKLPAEHPYSGNKSKNKLATEWPGATDAHNIDLFLNYLFLTPRGQEEKAVMRNIYWILHEVMDVSDSDKVAAIIRVHSAQTDVTKKRKIAMCAAELFPYLMDVKLLALVRDLLDDDTVIKTVRPEGLRARVVTVRGETRKLCLSFILKKEVLDYKLAAADYPHINKENRPEAEYCKAMKNWMITNWNAITAAAFKAKANHLRNYRRPNIVIFNPKLPQ